LLALIKTWFTCWAQYDRKQVPLATTDFYFFGSQKVQQFSFFSSTGYDLIEWLMDRLSIEDSRKFKNKKQKTLKMAAGVKRFKRFCQKSWLTNYVAKCIVGRKNHNRKTHSSQIFLVIQVNL